MKRVFLVGMMGAGKTTVGRALAEHLGYPYLDSDEQVEKATGKTVAQIFEERGEAAFRAEEKRALAQALTSDGPVVVSVAGGAVLDPENRRRLRQAGLVVWLRASLQTLARRVEGAVHRPLLGDDPRTALTRLYQQRRHLYQEVADLVVDVDHLSPHQVTQHILGHLRSG
ncbi:MAG: shikimate kinase [Actinomycetota bacterium]|nr:shikimate kinase [Actinomycetota bacterium]